jgi:hypothetical protein
MASLHIAMSICSLIQLLSWQHAHVRRKPLFILLMGCFLVTAVVVTLIGSFSSPSQPQHEGRSLGYWLHLFAESSYVRDETEELAKDTQWKQSREAIRQIGTNALPYLLAWIACEPSSLKMSMLSAILKVVPVNDHTRSFLKILFHEYLRADDAVAGFAILGESAAMAIPDLVRLASDPKRDRSSYRATEALFYIGPRSLPALSDIMTNPSAPRRYLATVVVGKLGTNALPVVPILLDLLVDPDSALRKAATSSLRKIAPEFLTNSLSAP